MSEETNNPAENVIRMICVCAFCNNHQSDGVSIELNFRDMSIYYMCNGCGKLNTLELKPISAKPYPKTRLMR